MGQDSRTLVIIEPEVYIIIATLLLIFPVSWVISWICAIVLHELLHCVSLCLLGYSVFEIRFYCVGAKIISAPVAKFHAILCTAAGPIGSLLVLPFSAKVPQLSLCILIQSAFNLLPIYPLDGGRILRGLLSYLKNDELEETLAIMIEWFVISIITLISMTASFRFKLGIIPLVIPAFLLVKTQKIKIPCKQTRHRVQ